MSDEINDTLQERAKTYGAFRQVAMTAQDIKHTAQANSAVLIGSSEREAIDMIASKLARIICGDSRNRDSWLDIAGYAMLVVKDIDSTDNT